MKHIARSHFIIGGVFITLFLLSGVYMLFSFPDVYQGREEVRMMFRSTHIYILMSSLLNFMTGCYLSNYTPIGFSKLRQLASWLILIAPILLFVAFIVEPPTYLIERPISFWGVLSLLIGVLLHALLNMPWLRRWNK